jgi:hypothetical protein
MLRNGLPGNPVGLHGVEKNHAIFLKANTGSKLMGLLQSLGNPRQASVRANKVSMIEGGLDPHGDCYTCPWSWRVSMFNAFNYLVQGLISSHAFFAKLQATQAPLIRCRLLILLGNSSASGRITKAGFCSAALSRSLSEENRQSL